MDDGCHGAGQRDDGRRGQVRQFLHRPRARGGARRRGRRPHRPPSQGRHGLPHGRDAEAGLRGAVPRGRLDHCAGEDHALPGRQRAHLLLHPPGSHRRLLPVLIARRGGFLPAPGNVCALREGPAVRQGPPDVPLLPLPRAELRGRRPVRAIHDAPLGQAAPHRQRARQNAGGDHQEAGGHAEPSALMRPVRGLRSCCVDQAGEGEAPWGAPKW
mmetsp:Transcript_37442/g.111074  ORF Transcript_37442/g.111074 Transcript_37442/m.111074 type:complete len:214 (-) Transcript_37442:33-674(-)